MDPAATQPLVHKSHGNLDRPEVLGDIGVAFSGAELPAQKEVRPTRGSRRRWIEPAEERELAGAEAGLLLELSAGGVPGVLSGFDTPSRKFEHIGADRGPVILHENDLTVVGNRYDTGEGAGYQP